MLAGLALALWARIAAVRALRVAALIAGIQVFLAYSIAGKLENSPKLYGTLGASTVVLLVLYLIARLLISTM